jgi:hypothetical protein
MLPAHVPSLHGDYDKEHGNDGPKLARYGFATIMHWTIRFKGQVGRAVGRNDDHADNPHRNRIPVEQPDIPTHSKICKKGHVELAILLERNTTDHVVQSSAEKNSQEHVRDRKYKIPEGLPHPIIDMAADLQRNATKNQGPENQKESQIVAREGGPQETRKGNKHHSAKGILAFTLIVYVTLDGRNFGAGVLHLIVTKTSVRCIAAGRIMLMNPDFASRLARSFS